MDRVFRVAMPQVVLYESKVVALVGQVEATGVAEGVRVDRFQARSLSCGVHKIADRLASQRLPAFTEKQPREFALPLAQVPLDRAKLIAGNRMFDGQAVLQSSDPESRLLKVEIVASHGNELTHT